MKKFFAGILVTVSVIILVSVFFVKNANSIDPFSINIPSSSSSISVTPDNSTLVTKIQNLNRLETVTMKMKENFIGNKDNDVLWGLLREKLVFVANGEVVAGIDFSKFEASDVNILDNGVVKIAIPMAEIFYSIVDNDSSFVQSRAKGFLVFFNDVNMETSIRRCAQNSFKTIALENKIIFEAQTNGINNIQDLAHKLGFNEVIVTVK